LLTGLCSSNMVDIFEIAPQQDPTTPRAALTPFAYAGQEARIVRYQHLLSKLAAKNDDGLAPPGVQIDWLPQDEDPMEMQRNVPALKVESGAALVGTFADAAAAMA
jgi:hypothetical protein